MVRNRRLPASLACAIWAAASIAAVAQRGTQPTVTVVSPEIGGDRRVTFRTLAPDAQKVELRSPGDIPGIAAESTSFGEAWEKQHSASLDSPAAKHGLRLLWFSTGRDDALITTTRATVEVLKKHGFNPVFIESEGAHTWLNWRNYLAEFAPQLFVGAESSSSQR
jgi:hypothetical protein